ncbi:MAG: superoxide dismutase [Parcubacteria group bacterium]|nr:superoxide dismutase [Parcubacteria group bacterium]
MHPYQEKTFGLGGLEGFSEKQISEHLKLYAGYVKNVNKLSSDIVRLEGDEANTAAVSELRRRFGFEFCGLRLHELYFEVLGTSKGLDDGNLKNALMTQFVSFDAWMNDFKKTGMMRGIGWALLVQDPQSGNLFNVWVSDHEVGHLAGLPILLAMDVWEHAYAVDFLPTGRKEYIEAFFKNLNWGIIESRLK